MAAADAVEQFDPIPYRKPGLILIELRLLQGRIPMKKMTDFCILIPPTREAIRGFLKAHAKNAKQSQVLKNSAAVVLSAPKTPLYSCIWTTSPQSSNTRIIARCDRWWERYFAYAIALRMASGPAYQIGPYRNNSLIRSKPSLSLRGRTS